MYSRALGWCYRSVAEYSVHKLLGKALAGYVLAEANDGYQVVFSLGELDPSFIDTEIL